MEEAEGLRPYQGVSSHGERIAPSWRAQRLLLAGLILLYLSLVYLWSVTVPLGEGPDEPAHWDYALFVARTGRLPIQLPNLDQSLTQASSPDTQHSTLVTRHSSLLTPHSSSLTDHRPPATDHSFGTQYSVPGEGHQPPLYYWLLQPTVQWLAPEAQVLAVMGNPDFRWAGGEAPNAYLHGARELPPYQGQVLAWHLARGISALLGALSVGLCWATARLVLPDEPFIALGAAALAAFNPQWLFQHALVSNDPLLIMLSSALIYGCVRLVTSRGKQEAGGGHAESTGMSVGLGILLGLMLITKQSGLLFVPLPLMAYWVAAAGHPHPRRWQTWLRSTVITLAIAVLLSGWWYLRNARLYGDPLGLGMFRTTFAGDDFDWQRLDDWRAGAWSLLRSSWGMFGWQTVPLPDGAYHMLLTVLGLAVVGLLLGIAQGTWRERGRPACVLVATLALLAIWMLAWVRTAGMVAWQGRFLFPGIVVFSLLLARGLAAVIPRRFALVAVAATLMVLAASLPRGLLAPTYPIYARAAPVEPTQTLYGAFDFGWKRGVELRGAAFPARVQLGESLPLTLTWHVVEPLDRPWWLFVHLVDEEGDLSAKLDAQPLNGRYPVNHWVPGDWYEDPKRVDLAGLRPGRYELQVGLWDPQTTERLNVYDRKRVLLGDYVVAGTVTIAMQ